MPSTFFGLDIGYTGLSIYQNALNTTAHNITNAETEGYSRQYLGRKAGKAISISSSYGMVGTGVIGTGVEQKRDTYYDVKYRDANTLYGEYAGKSYYMNEIEDYFNEEDGEGFSTNFASMYTTFEELAKDPSSQSARRQVLNYSLAFTEYFNSLSTNLRKIQEEVNFEIKNCVDRINSIGTQIATLTKQINTIEVKGTKANDLRDERNKLIDELSELADIQVKEEDIGMKADQTSVNLTAFTVKINGRYLVNNYASSSLELVPRDIKANLNDVDGLYDITWSDGQNFEMYGNTIGGKLASLIEVRDGNNEDALNGFITASEGDTEVTMTMTNCNDIRKLNIPENGRLVIGNQEYEYKSFSVDIDENGQYAYKFQLDESKPLVTNTYDTEVPNARIGHLIDYKGLPYYLSMMNEFVRTFAKEFNAIHKTGEDLDGNKGIDFFGANHPVTGEPYVFIDELGQEADDEAGIEERAPGFTSDDQSYYKVTAGNFTVNKALLKDERMIACADHIKAGVEDSNVWHKLIDLKDKVTMFKQGKPESFFQTLVSDVGIDTDKAKTFERSQKDIVATVDNERISISGVDTDEEAMDLIRFQTAYNLSAKVISVMDEVFDKLINEMAV